MDNFLACRQQIDFVKAKFINFWEMRWEQNVASQLSRQGGIWVKVKNHCSDGSAVLVKNTSCKCKYCSTIISYFQHPPRTVWTTAVVFCVSISQLCAMQSPADNRRLRLMNSSGSDWWCDSKSFAPTCSNIWLHAQKDLCYFGITVRLKIYFCHYFGYNCGVWKLLFRMLLFQLLRRIVWSYLMISATTWQAPREFRMHNNTPLKLSFLLCLTMEWHEYGHILRLTLMSHCQGSLQY